MFCALCFNNLGTTEAIPLFLNNEETDLANIIQQNKLLNMTLVEEVVYKNICNICSTHLNDFKEFCRYVRERQNAFKETKLFQAVSEQTNVLETKKEYVPAPLVKPNETRQCKFIGNDLIKDQSLFEDEFPINIKDEVDFSIDIKDEYSGGQNFNGISVAQNEDYVSDDIDDMPLQLLMQKSRKKSAKCKTSGVKPKVLSKVKRKARELSKPMDNEVCNIVLTDDAKTARIESKRRFDNTEESQKNETFIAAHMKLKCEVCQSPMETFMKLKKHFRTAHSTQGYVSCCDKRFYKRYALVTHILQHVKPEAFKCQVCGKVLKNKYCLDFHMENKHSREENLKFTCSDCGRKFAYAHILKAHALTHQNERDYNCELCDKAFKTNFALTAHIRSIHENVKPYICEICGRDFKCKLSFKRHVDEHQGTSVPEPTEQCKICGKWYTKRCLRRHMYVHNQTQVECDECGRAVISKQALYAHKINVHQMKANLKCNFCEKTFKKPKNLKEHIGIHTGAKDHSCPHCLREFRSKANMYVHIKRTHVKEWLQAQAARTKGPTDSQFERQESIAN